MKTIKLLAREAPSAILCVVLVALVLVGLAGCAPASMPDPGPPGPEMALRYPKAQSVDTYDLPSVYLVDVTLKDGTRCVYIYNAGLDCDFKGERRAE